MLNMEQYWTWCVADSVAHQEPFAGLGAQYNPHIDLSMAILNATGRYMLSALAGVNRNTHDPSHHAN